MVERSRLAAIAELIRDNITIEGIEDYCRETGIGEGDFKRISPQEFDGKIFGVDGSNVVIYDWHAASLNHIRAGYVLYEGKQWQKTVIVYDDLFLAEPKDYARQFEPYLRIFGPERSFHLDKTELDRLSSYFRELQEYVALWDALRESKAGDLILYDGSFASWKGRPFHDVLSSIFQMAAAKGIDLLAISKSSNLSWGKEGSRPFVPHTAYAGGRLLPAAPWYVEIRGKRIEASPIESWEGRVYVAKLYGPSEVAFRVDAPSHAAEHIGAAMAGAARHSGSAECPGYPHALFRAHRDIRISESESRQLRLSLFDALGDIGLRESSIRHALLDYHEVMEMRR